MTDDNPKKSPEKSSETAAAAESAPEQAAAAGKRKRAPKKAEAPETDAPDPANEEAKREHLAMERRAFLIRTGTAAGLALGASWAALAPPEWPLSIKDPDGERGKPRKILHKLPENGFAVDSSATASVIGIARGQRLDAMLRGAIDAIGGMTRFIQRGDVVVIKPNVAFERAAPLGATSNPEVVSALIRLVREAGASEVRVADNPIESPEACFARSGIRKAATRAGARVYLPTEASFETLNVPGATWIENWPFFWRPFKGANKVIGIAPVKDHNLCRASMTTKNWYGLLGGRRNQFHQDIHGIISDLALMLKPSFVVLDGSRVLFRSGPTGGSLADVRSGGTIAASTDSLAVDAFGWDDLLGRKGEPLPDYFQQAAARGLGQPDWRSVAKKEVQVG